MQAASLCAYQSSFVPSSVEPTRLGIAPAAWAGRLHIIHSGLLVQAVLGADATRKARSDVKGVSHTIGDLLLTIHNVHDSESLVPS